MADNHGNTPAAWTAVALGLLGFVVGSVGLMLSPINYVVFWIGVALVLVAGVAFVVLGKMGYHTESH
ncbi:HGxxPAAW family protein [Nocardioides sp.]|uniref:HGxxPAAW family protein n=1 Tax=Nocardioides sp. TaxID=35761 RepID=UPI002617F624|nr:HGxxPAAW family protein [Nocardioides sp.]